jgi:hypothetical protein
MNVFEHAYFQCKDISVLSAVRVCALLPVKKSGKNISSLLKVSSNGRPLRDTNARREILTVAKIEIAEII